MEPNATLLGQLITFLVLVWFIWKYVWPPITKSLHEREVKIAAGIAASEQSKRELEETTQKVAEIIRGAKEEASHIIDQAHKRSQQLLEDAKESARIESKRIVEQASEEILREVTQAKEALRKQLASLAVLGAEKIIRRNLDVNTQAALLDEFVAEI